LETYRLLRDFVQHYNDPQKEEILAVHPELSKISRISSVGDGILIQLEGEQRTFTFNTTLPRKKGTVDDIFVFKKKI